MKTPSKAALGFILVAFGMLWIPLGQHDFLIEHWMKLGVFMAPFLLFVAAAFRSESSKGKEIDLKFWSLILLVTYIIHQFEEHWVDLFGNIYAFKPYLNSLLRERFGGTGNSTGPLSDAGVFVINTSLVWLVASLGIWRAPQHLFPALCMASIVIVNAFSHIGAAVVTLGYNPGLLTAVTLFIPLGLTAYSRSLRNGQAKIGEVAASIVWGILAHIVMIAGMIATGWFRIIPESVYFVVLVSWSILPVFLYRRANHV
ncbi:MAG: HXXEE domain-containing protein [Verrucomicrobiota bacterium]